jgi:hypothetical protein
MTVSTRSLENFEEQAAKLGCTIPEGICVFPRNFDVAVSPAELVYDDSAQTLRKLLKRAGVQDNGQLNEKNNYMLLRSDLPVICLFAGWTVLTQDPTSVQLALGVAANYLTDLCKGFRRPEEQECEVKVIRERITNSKRFFEETSYKGPVSGLEAAFNALPRD